MARGCLQQGRRSVGIQPVATPLPSPLLCHLCAALPGLAACRPSPAPLAARAPPAACQSDHPRLRPCCLQGWDGKKSDFGAVNPELLYGDKGWCVAEEPEYRCPCILVSFAGWCCRLAGGRGRKLCWLGLQPAAVKRFVQPKVAGLVLCALSGAACCVGGAGMCRMAWAAASVRSSTRPSAPTSATVRRWRRRRRREARWLCCIGGVAALAGPLLGLAACF